MAIERKRRIIIKKKVDNEKEANRKECRNILKKQDIEKERG